MHKSGCCNFVTSALKYLGLRLEEIRLRNSEEMKSRFDSAFLVLEPKATARVLRLFSLVPAVTCGNWSLNWLIYYGAQYLTLNTSTGWTVEGLWIFQCLEPSVVTRHQVPFHFIIFSLFFFFFWFMLVVFWQTALHFLLFCRICGHISYQL